MATSMTALYEPNESQRFGLIILGNSGVGKSFLANLFLQKERFLHLASPKAVTTVTESIEYKIGTTTYVIFNIPGLVEAKQEQIDLNKREIDKAFQHCPNAVVIYVFGNQNGRIRNEDVIAFRALNDAYPFGLKSLVLVVNGIPVDREENYEGETIVLLTSLIRLDTEYNNVCFLDWINKRNNEEKLQLRNKLLQAVLDALPKVHQKQHDIRLQMDEINVLKDQCNKMQLEFNKQREDYRAEIEASQQRHQQEMYQKQQTMERMKEEMALQQRKYNELEQKLVQQGANFVANALFLTRNPYAALVGTLIAIGANLASKEPRDDNK